MECFADADVDRLSSLPWPALSRVLLGLSPGERAAAGCVCRRLLGARYSPEVWTHLDLSAFPGHALSDEALVSFVSRSRTRPSGAYALLSLDVSGAHSVSFDCLTSVVRGCSSLVELTMLSAGSEPMNLKRLVVLADARRAAAPIRAQPLALSLSWCRRQLPDLLSVVRSTSLPVRVAGLDLSWRSDSETVFSAAALHELAAALECSLPTTLLNLSGVCDGGDATALAAMVRLLSHAAGSLQALSLAANDLDGEACIALDGSLRGAMELHTLSLAQNPKLAHRAAGVEALARTLHSLPRLTCLNLRGCGLGDEAAAALVRALTPSLRALTLSHNPAGGGAGGGGGLAAAALALALTNGHLTRLCSLDLTACRLGPSGARALAGALGCHDCGLTSLLLGANDLLDAGVCDLCAALEHNSRLKELDLSSNSICLNAKGAATLTALHGMLAMLSSNATLLRIRLAGNATDAAGLALIVAIGQALTCNRAGGRPQAQLNAVMARGFEASEAHETSVDRHAQLYVNKAPVLATR